MALIVSLADNSVNLSCVKNLLFRATFDEIQNLLQFMHRFAGQLVHLLEIRVHSLRLFRHFFYGFHLEKVACM